MLGKSSKEQVGDAECQYIHLDLICARKPVVLHQFECVQGNCLTTVAANQTELAQDAQSNLSVILKVPNAAAECRQVLSRIGTPGGCLPKTNEPEETVMRSQFEFDAAIAGTVISICPGPGDATRYSAFHPGFRPVCPQLRHKRGLDAKPGRTAQ